jgi:hypothetical protein
MTVLKSSFPLTHYPLPISPFPHFPGVKSFSRENDETALFSLVNCFTLYYYLYVMKMKREFIRLYFCVSQQMGMMPRHHPEANENQHKRFAQHIGSQLSSPRGRGEK